MKAHTQKGFAPLEIANSHGQNKIQGMKFIQRKSLTGFATLYFVLLALFLVVSITGSSFLLVSWQQRVGRNTQNSVQAYWAAEAGIEDAFLRLKKGLSWTNPITFDTGEGIASVTITEPSPGSHLVAAQGDDASRIRKIQAVSVLNTTTPQFHYGVLVGQGGVIMGENSRVEGAGGTAGNFYSNGAVIGDNDATITGDVTVATGILLAEKFTVCNADQVVGQADPQIDFAQSFRAPDSKPLNQVSLYLKKVGNPADRTIHIVSDVAGVPGTSALASATLNASLVTTSYSWADIAFSLPAVLTSGNTYWIILDANKDANKYWVWCKDGGEGYANGQVKYSKDWDDKPWTGVSGDLNFKTYLGTGTSSLDQVIVYGTARANSITNSKICGDAYYQATTTIDASSKSFLDSPTNPTCGGNPLTPGTGFPNQPDPPVSSMPISQGNIDQWKADAQSGGQHIGNFSVTSDTSLGPKEVTGDLLVTTNNRVFTITGIVYVRGNININGNGSTIKCSSSYGANSCVVVADGWIHTDNNVTFQGSGQSGSYIMLLTTLAGCNGGNQQSQCTHHNGAIDVHNNATGAIFYTTNSMANLHNGVNVSEITAYKLELGNNAVVTYEQGLLNTQFSSGPGASFELVSWKEVE